MREKEKIFDSLSVLSEEGQSSIALTSFAERVYVVPHLFKTLVQLGFDFSVLYSRSVIGTFYTHLMYNNLHLIEVDYPCALMAGAWIASGN